MPPHPISVSVTIPALCRCFLPDRQLALARDPLERVPSHQQSVCEPLGHPGLLDNVQPFIPVPFLGRVRRRELEAADNADGVARLGRALFVSMSPWNMYSSLEQGAGRMLGYGAHLESSVHGVLKALIERLGGRA